MVEELIPQVSAILIGVLMTGLIAYYFALCKAVKEFMDKRKEEYTNEFSQYYGREVEKSGINTKHSLIAMRNSFFASIILFAITTVLCFSVYSSYAIYSFLLTLGLILYGFCLFIGI